MGGGAELMLNSDVSEAGLELDFGTLWSSRPQVCLPSTGCRCDAG